MALKDLPKMLRHLGRIISGQHPVAPAVDLSRKKIIVTGASPGSIGFETALTLASWGASVIITTRAQPDAAASQLRARLKQSGKNGDIDAHALDLTSANSVETFVRWYQQQHGQRLDVLVNNAGVHLDLTGQWKQAPLTPDGFEIHWRTNFLGPLHLTHRLLPLLRQTGKSMGEARVVFVSSHVHTRASNASLGQAPQPYDSWQAYGQSKLALNHCAFEIQRRFASDHLQGFALHPGSIYTNIAGKGLANKPLLLTLRNLFAPLEKMILLSPQQGAQTSILCASQPGLRGGQYFERCAPAEPSPELDDTATAARLWDSTAAWVDSLPRIAGDFSQSIAREQPARASSAHV